ncbi:MAG: extracellular solute-binding protein [Chthonomonadales bacterium]|nr:extracellular solute-binding protein [Chthonomonadales bacterium]
MTRQRRWLLVAALLAACAGGCGRKSGSPASGSEVEVALFKGGYGIDFFEQAAREYEQKHPGVRLKVWGNPRVWEQLRPRFVAGTPPDLAWPGWGMDYWPLVYEGQVTPLDDALAGPAYDGKGIWRDTFEPSLLRLGQYDGKQYMLPYYFSINGWWYDRHLFAKHGWQPPRTFSELLSLCEKIKAAGIAPITYQGKYPYYMVTGFLLPWAISAGGIQAVDDAQNLVPGAWKSPAFLQAARMVRELKDRGFFQEGANGMSHTESQMEFVSGRAAMIPCGTWLYSEMSKQLPPADRFQMVYFLPPVLDDGPGDPTNVAIGIEPWVVPTRGKHRDTAIDFYKYLTSLPKAKEFVEQKGTLMSIKGSDQAKLPEHLEEPARAFREARTVWSVEYVQWYPALGTASQNAMAALLNGEASPEEFVQRLEDAAEKIRRDRTVPRHQVAPH